MKELPRRLETMPETSRAWPRPGDRRLKMGISVLGMRRGFVDTGHVTSLDQSEAVSGIRHFLSYAETIWDPVPVLLVQAGARR